MAQAVSPAFARHGGRIDDARRAFPEAPAPWIDLSTGINPNPWTPPSALTFDPAPLPGLSDLRALEATAARYFRVAPDRVAAVPGSEVALRLLPTLALPKPITAFRPSYGTHIDVADAIAGAIDPGAGTLLLANPNNPDGRVLPPASLLPLTEAQRRAGGWLVVDEAFIDAAPADSILPALTHDAPVVVARSFGKFFGLAGVRLGFIVAPAPIIANLRRLLGDWPVSAQAIAWGTAAYADAAWIADTRRDLADRAARLDALLARHGLTATGGSPLFRLVANAQAGALFDRLAQAGILTRPFRDQADWLRFGLPRDDVAFDRLDRALAHG